jgi:hypothetical protein
MYTLTQHPFTCRVLGSFVTERLLRIGPLDDDAARPEAKYAADLSRIVVNAGIRDDRMSGSR